MGKIRSLYRGIPLWLTVFLFAAVSLIFASAASDRVTHLANLEMGRLLSEYTTVHRSPDGYVSYTDLPGDGEGAFVRYQSERREMTPEDSARYGLLRLTARAAPPLIYFCFLLGAAILFYFTKLRRPVRLLMSAYDKIARNEYDFSLDYEGRDEMGKLCAAFESMRRALDGSHRRMRGMIEERKRLNDAYTHDIRTPIAVLKGYTGILARFLPTGQLSQEKLMATVNTMAAHVERLEQFANSMNTAQRLADVTIRRERVDTEELVNTLRETAAVLCENIGLTLETDWAVEVRELNIDQAAVSQVFENLLGNALRFAGTRISIRLESDGRTLTLRVADDGRGFTDTELTAAARPYYSGEQRERTYHFGLGLYICRTLCERHGGGLKLENSGEGGAVVMAVFSM